VIHPRAVVVVHGAAVLLLGLLLGLAAVVEEISGTQPLLWRAGHNALLLAGVWLLATAAVLPLLVLPARQVAALCWSLVVTAWAFATAILIQAITGVRALSPGATVPGTVGFVANIVTVGAGLLAGVLTLVGAWGALKADRTPRPLSVGPGMARPLPG
jgi:hypothetical protein